MNLICVFMGLTGVRGIENELLSDSVKWVKLRQHP